jgi:hypothetical protein
MQDNKKTPDPQNRYLENVTILQHPMIVLVRSDKALSSQSFLKSYSYSSSSDSLKAGQIKVSRVLNGGGIHGLTDTKPWAKFLNPYGGCYEIAHALPGNFRISEN